MNKKKWMMLGAAGLCLVGIVVLIVSLTKNETVHNEKNKEAAVPIEQLKETESFEQLVTSLSSRSSTEEDENAMLSELNKNGAKKKQYYSPDEVFVILEAYHQAMQENVNTSPPPMDETVEAVEKTLQSERLNTAQKQFLNNYYAVVQVMDEKMGTEKSWEERQSTYKEISIYGEAMKKLKKTYKSSIGDIDIFTSYEYNQLFAAS